MRIPQPEGSKGSLKWIQKALEIDPNSIQPVSLPPINWTSPLREDDFAEYRDGGFLDLIGLSSLSDKLKMFWPSRGPQWDALGTFDGGVVLVEAKAHISEFLTPGSGASEKSLLKITDALHATQEYLDARPNAAWEQTFYQYTNRLAHLYFLRKHGVNAHLIFASFLNDDEMNGPRFAETWQAVFLAADYSLGIPKKHKLSKFIHHTYPDVTTL